MEGKVLIVDDDPDACEILGRILDALGLTTRTASNGIEALSYVKTELPDLILLDLMMPLMDGFQVLFNLKGNPATRYIPVIVVTGYSVGQDMLKLPGVEQVIQKSSLSVSEMQAAVTDLLSRQLERSSAQPQPIQRA